MPHLPHTTMSEDGQSISIDAESLLYPQIRRFLTATPWAILPDKLNEIQELIALRAAGVRFSVDEIQARIGFDAAAARRVSSEGSVAVIPIYGVLSQRMNLMSMMSGGTSTEQLSDQVRQAMADDDVGAIVFDVDSPGGNVNGIPELADELFGYRGQKPMVAVVNPLNASAAYWLTSQMNEIVITPSGQTGSIGVVAMHQDVSGALANEGVAVNLITAGKYKAEGNPYQPLDDEARDAIQSSVNDYYGMFVDAVARGRGVKASDVRNGFGEGRVLGAKAAVSAGLADRVDTLKGTIARLSSGQGRARVKAEAPATELTASTVGDDHELWRLANY